MSNNAIEYIDLGQELQAEQAIQLRFRPSIAKSAWAVREKKADDGQAKVKNVYPDRHPQIAFLMTTLRAQCKNDNWDGEESSAINHASSAAAWRFLLWNLPETLPLPTLWCDPVGRVNAEWHNKNVSFAITFKDDRSFVFAGYNTRIPEVFFKTSSTGDIIEGMHRLLG